MECETKWRTLGEGDVRPEGYQRRKRQRIPDSESQWEDGLVHLVGLEITADNTVLFEYRAPVTDEAPAPPEGYEIVDSEAEPNAVIQKGWKVYGRGNWEDAYLAVGKSITAWIDESWTAVARPIRKPAPAPRSFWVRASERQPPMERRVPIRGDVAGFLGYATVDVSGNWYLNGKLSINDSLSLKEWLDLDAAEAIAAERDRLADENERLRDALSAANKIINAEAGAGADSEAQLRARVAELEAENDWLRRERDALVDGLCRQGEWFRGIVRGVMGAREVN